MLQIFGTVTDNVCFFYIADYLKKHNALGEEYAIIKTDCALLFRAVPLNDQDEAVLEKWHLIGQCLSKICSKRCSWSNVEVTAAVANVCNFATVTKRFFVTESEDWVKEFQRKETQKASSVGEGDEISNSGSQHKKCGTHKSIEYLKHWYQLCELVQGRHAKRGISESWYDSWREFACEEITLKKNKK
jgi:hypothetical protein